MRRLRLEFKRGLKRDQKKTQSTTTQKGLFLQRSLNFYVNTLLRSWRKVNVCVRGSQQTYQSHITGICVYSQCTWNDSVTRACERLFIIMTAVRITLIKKKTPKKTTTPTCFCLRLMYCTGIIWKLIKELNLVSLHYCNTHMTSSFSLIVSKVHAQKEAKSSAATV